MNTPTPPRDPRAAWRQALAAGPDCLPIEQLATPTLVPAAQAHVDACARCQAERALWLEFQAAEPASDEGAAVPWIARETKRRVFPSPDDVAAPARGGWFRLPRWVLALAAAAAVGVGAWVLMVRPEPAIEGPAAGDVVYRSRTVVIVSPVGDVAVMPDVLRWEPLPGAEAYRVEVLEVDGTPVWQGETGATSIQTPEAVRLAARPARTLTWQVTGIDGSMQPVATPGVATFRVASGGATER